MRYRKYPARRALAVVAATSLAAMSLAAAAVLRAPAESFDGYGQSTIVGEPAASPLLAGTWSATGDAAGFRVMPDSLAYPGVTATGGRLEVAPNGQTLSVPLNLDASGPLAAMLDGGDAIGRVNEPVYLSLLLRRHGDAVQGAQGLLTLAGPGGFEYSVGQVWQGKTFGNSAGAPSSVPLDTQTHMLVLKLGRYDWGNQVDVYIDPVPGRPEAEQVVDLKGWPAKDNPLRVGELRFKANGNAWSFDEIRLGRSFQAVAPAAP